MVGAGRCPAVALLVVVYATQFACGDSPGRDQWVNPQTGIITSMTTDERLLSDCVDTMTHLVNHRHTMMTDGVEGGNELGR